MNRLIFAAAAAGMLAGCASSPESIQPAASVRADYSAQKCYSLSDVDYRLARDQSIALAQHKYDASSVSAQAVASVTAEREALKQEYWQRCRKKIRHVKP